MSRQELLERAKQEWEEDGVLAADTYIHLDNLGVDVDALIDNYEQQGS